MERANYILRLGFSHIVKLLIVTLFILGFLYLALGFHELIERPLSWIIFSNYTFMMIAIALSIKYKNRIAIFIAYFTFIVGMVGIVGIVFEAPWWLYIVIAGPIALIFALFRTNVYIIIICLVFYWLEYILHYSMQDINDYLARHPEMDRKITFQLFIAGLGANLPKPGQEIVEKILFAMVMAGIVLGGGNLGETMSEGKRKFEKNQEKLKKEAVDLRRRRAQRYEVDRVDRALGRTKQEIKREDIFYRYDKKK